ncbi:hypothetical protein JCM14076_06950 [Methylosoma difficile]
MNYDIFVSHASEDKDEIARPLALLLQKYGILVWLDDFELTLGDSLRRSIDYGLSQSHFGVVILSHAFFAKEWPQKELDALVAREDGQGKVILPIWHNLGKNDIIKYSPLLADKLAASTSKGLPNVADKIIRAIQKNYNKCNVIKSACGINYDTLRNLLESSQWKEANQESSRLLIRSSGREVLGPLDMPGMIGTLGDRDIYELPCQDLKILDKLWSKYSYGRFGFSAQAGIIAEINGENIWDEFCHRVGWNHSKIIYELHSPVGHLPTPPPHYHIHHVDTDYINNMDRALWWNVATILARFKECTVEKSVQDK